VRLVSLFFVLVIPMYVFAAPKDSAPAPLTGDEHAKLESLIHNSHLVDCLAIYKFDFFANELGLAVEENGAKSEGDLVTQLRKYLKSGKLEQVDPKEKVPQPTAQRCDIIAQTVIELWALRMQGQGNGPQ